MTNVTRNALIFAAFSLTSLALVGCEDDDESPAAAVACTAQFAGNSSDSVNLTPICGVLSFSPNASDAGADAAVGTEGGYVLSLFATTKQIAQLKVSIDLGPSPAAGSFSPENVANWSVTGLSGGGTNCEYSAGSDYVPSGNFTLTLTSVDVADGGTGQAHGTLDLTTNVHAPPGTDCGVGDTEEVVFDF
jgi:hypothetical protein